MTVKDFDATQRAEQDKVTEEFGDHEFTLRGETFRIRRTIPFGVLAALTGVKNNTDDSDAIMAVEKAVVGLLAGGPEEKQRFRDLIRDTETEFPVTYLDLIQVQNWMIEEASGNPPTQPVSSSESPSTNGVVGTASFSTKPAAA